MSKKELLENILKERIMIMNGPFGTYTKLKLGSDYSEEFYRGEVFKDHSSLLCGQGELLNFSQPDFIQGLMEDYLEAGADFATTATFNGASVELSKHKFENLSYKLNKKSAELASAACKKYSTKEKPRFVLGSLGPLSHTLSVGTNVEDPAAREVTFEELVKAYKEQMYGLVDGGMDVILIETIFDVLNAKSAIYAVFEYYEENPEKERLPIILSGTIGKSGRTLSGQTPESLYISTEHCGFSCMGLNCGLGATFVYEHVESLSKLVKTSTACWPNAGLPNEFGCYNQNPEQMGELCAKMLRLGHLNIIGGCCGANNEHIRKITEISTKFKPRKIPEEDHKFRLCGLDPLIFEPSKGKFLKVGNGCHVKYSESFKTLIEQENFSKCVEIARKQVIHGAHILDICVDDIIDDEIRHVKLTRTFMNHLCSDPEVSRVPMMIESTRFEVITAALRCLQGKAIVNCLSLQNGEEEFITQANEIRKYGAAVIIKLGDEKTPHEEKLEICRKAYDTLTKKLNYPSHDIVFDPIFVKKESKGISEYFELCGLIKKEFPHCLIFGDVSKVSIGFMDDEKIRETVNSVFLHHVVEKGMLDIALMNVEKVPKYESIDPKLLELVENVLFHKHEDDMKKLEEFAKGMDQETEGEGDGSEIVEEEEESWRSLGVCDRLKYALKKGVSEFIFEDLKECLEKENMGGLEILEGPLMGGMREIGDAYGEGEMFLLQVIQSARMMKLSMGLLEPYMEKSTDSDRGSIRKDKVLMATVKGDVHDIGKNIVSTVLECNGYEVIDLGSMVLCETILEAAIKNQVQSIGLSGLITPSLDEMVYVAKKLEKIVSDNKFSHRPLLMVGGASTSEIHAFVKISPFYNPVVHVEDASKVAFVLKEYLTDPNHHMRMLKEKQERVVDEYRMQIKNIQLVSLETARSERLEIDWENSPPMSRPKEFCGECRVFEFPAEEVSKKIDWRYFFSTMGVWSKNKEFHEGIPKIWEDKEVGTECKKLYDFAIPILEKLIHEGKMKCSCVIGFYPARPHENKDDIVLYRSDEDYEKDQNGEVFYSLRQQLKKENAKERYRNLADYICSHERSYVGLYAGGVKLCDPEKKKEILSENEIVADILLDRMAEALAEHAHEMIRRELWGYSPDENLSLKELLDMKYQGIRTAIGFPSLPDHQMKFHMWEFMSIEEKIGISLTESSMMVPKSSVCCWIFAHPQSEYFNIGKVGKDQIMDYSKRKNKELETVEKELGYILGYE